jgi:HD-like signal output (HDOD) protein
VNRLETFGLIAAQAARGEISFPTSVNAVLRLQQALNDPDCHMEDAIRLVLGEPQLAARTVALANSMAFNNGGRPITNVRAAVTRVGYRNLQMLVASLVVRQFGSRIEDPSLRAKAEQLWQHTVQVAALAQVFARRVTYVNPDTAMFTGIVHEVGGFYLLSRADGFPGLLDEDPEKWAELCEDVVTRERISQMQVPLQQIWQLWIMDEGRRRTGFGVWVCPREASFDKLIRSLIFSLACRLRLPD